MQEEYEFVPPHGASSSTTCKISKKFKCSCSLHVLVGVMHVSKSPTHQKSTRVNRTQFAAALKHDPPVRAHNSEFSHVTKKLLPRRPDAATHPRLLYAKFGSQSIPDGQTVEKMIRKRPTARTFFALTSLLLMIMTPSENRNRLRNFEQISVGLTSRLFTFPYLSG